MDMSAGRAAQLTAVLLVSLVATQIVYVALSASGADIDRRIIWGAETVFSLLIVAFAAGPLAHGSRFAAAWAAISGAGLLNVIQLAMGIAMFGPLFGGGQPLAPVAQTVAAAAFFILYAGKFLFGLAALLIGSAAAREGAGLTRIAGILAAISGAAALLFTTVAMAFGRSAIEAAPGASGTAAMFFLALILRFGAGPRGDASA
ncbi:hypothetical protein B5C34_14815 [Pacificimonas flava]|uniref:Thiamine biosynthesis protein ThiC n=2 Tax=Pacificimonas TaxID=1960290 RepID=A0A219B0E3_9SPHN|nr:MULTISPECIES: hypothetical protein [Pacificimonas]MBZ6379765.1 hypothetical protein [Pacificimonas aurantium]OWV31780.1 hypothetical protein B5C34_14815 [Pacificimonas flava]